MPLAILAAWQLWTVACDDPQYFPRLSTILVEFQRHVAVRRVRHARRAEPRADRRSASDRGGRRRRRSASRSASRAGRGSGRCRTSSTGARCRRRRCCRSRSSCSTHRQPAEGLVHRLLLHLPDPAEHDRRRARDRPDARRDRAVVQRARRETDPPARLPAALPQIVAGMRTSLSLAVIMMVLSEYFSSTSGVGYVLLISKNTFEIAPMWAAIVLIGCSATCSTSSSSSSSAGVLAWHRGWRAATPHERCSRSGDREDVRHRAQATRAIGEGRSTSRT